MKKFYTDPLQAAYMAKEFGVEFYGRDLEDGCEYNHTIDWLLRNATLGKEKWNSTDIMVHEDSLPIFKPMIGDLIFDEVVSRCNYEQYFILQENTKCGFGEPITDSFKEMGCFAILQRDGKQFFTPQEEV